jgi:hypothetical protein
MVDRPTEPECDVRASRRLSCAIDVLLHSAKLRDQRRLLASSGPILLDMRLPPLLHLRPRTASRKGVP